MSKLSRIKLGISRNWSLPGKERLASWLIQQNREENTNPFEGITWLKNEPLALHISTGSYIEWKILAEGTYEPATGNLISLSLRPGFVALDIGANIGVHSLRMARAVGEQGKVISCEPMPHLQHKLRANIHLNRLESIVEIVGEAISDVPGQTHMSGSPDTFNQGTGRMDAQGQTPVSVTTGDRLLAEKGIEQLDLIKIDIEGYEMKAIQGLSQSIARFKPRILVEYDQAYWEKCGSSWTEFKSLLEKYSYTIYKIEEFTLTKIHTSPETTSCNVFCIPGE
jgi:FkbM family methyltransferase